MTAGLLRFKGLGGALALAGFAIASMLGSSCKSRRDATQASVRVAAAADLTIAFGDLGLLFEKRTGQTALLTFGATGQLADEIAHGAPYDLFAAANAAAAESLAGRGLCLPASLRVYATGRLALWTPRALALPEDVRGLTASQVGHIAIADPERAPYGVAAKQALQSAGIWDEISSKIVYTKNVREALSTTKTAGADVALIALSLAVVSEGHYVLVDSALHAPLRQMLVLCPTEGRTEVIPAAAQFADFVSSSEGRSVLRRHGFSVPGDVTGDDGG